MRSDRMENEWQEGEVERRCARERDAIQRNKVDHDDWKKGEGKAQQSDQCADGRCINAEPEIPAEISLDEVPHACGFEFVLDLDGFAREHFLAHGRSGREHKIMTRS